MRGDNAYFVVTDHNTGEIHGIRIMRVCHVTGCPDGNSAREFTALYETNIPNCGRSLSEDDDTVCGVSVVEDFAGVSGTSLLISRCRLKSSFNNLVCLIPLSEVDRNMDNRYDECSAGRGELQRAWISEFDVPCVITGTNPFIVSVIDNC